MIHLNEGRLLLRDGGDDAAAARHLQRGAELAEKAGSVMMRMRTQESLALARRHQGRLQEALEPLNPVVAHWTTGEAPLALSSAQVDLLDGVLSAESSPGQGATFRVSLPWRSPEDPEPTAG